VRNCLWIVLAPLTAVVIVRSPQTSWLRTASAHVGLLLGGLLLDGLLLHRVAHVQATVLQRVSTLPAASANTPSQGAPPSVRPPWRAAVLRLYAAVDFRKPAGLRFWLGELLLILPLYVAMTILGYAVLAFRTSKARDQTAKDLERKLLEQRDESLRNRLSHHFLFNTFNTISALTLTDGPAARTCISQLSDLLRASIDAFPRGEVRLAREIEILQIYLRLQQTRFGAALEYAIDVEPGLQRAMVPAFLLQPLVENSFEHGFRDQAGVARVEVVARRIGDMLRLEVADNGACGEDAPRLAEKYGLGITRERLEIQYGGAARIGFEPNRPRGLRVFVEAPYREENESVA
jgi:two-component sensor histidine kinase